MILFKDGEIFSGGVARGRQKSFEKALEQLMNYLDANGGTPDDYRIIVGYGYDDEEGKRLWMQTRAALRARYPAAQCEVGLLQIGSTIAVHTGPYALGMGIMRRWKSSNRRIEKSSPIGRGFFVCDRVLSALGALRQTGRALVLVLFVVLRGRCGVGEPDFGDAAAGRAGHDALVVVQLEMVAYLGQMVGLFLHEAVYGVGVDVLILGQAQRLVKVVHAGRAGHEPAAVRLLAEVLGGLVVFVPDLAHQLFKNVLEVMMPSVPPYSSTTTAM